MKKQKPKKKTTYCRHNNNDNTYSWDTYNSVSVDK